MKKVIVTGVTGQTGSYMAEYLLNNTDCEVYGVVRKSSKASLLNLKSFFTNPRFHFAYGDLMDEDSIQEIIKTVSPDFFFNFAALSSPAESMDKKTETLRTNVLGVKFALSAIAEFVPKCRYLNAGSSTEFMEDSFQTPYGNSKKSARTIVQSYREEKSIFAVQPFMFNHESERRGMNFLSRKISFNIALLRANIVAFNLVQPFFLGNIDTNRAWLHAEDVVEVLWKIMNKPYPKDYDISSLKNYSIRDFTTQCAKEAGFKVRWEGEGYKEEMILEQLLINPAKNYRWCANQEKVVGIKIKSELYRPSNNMPQPSNEGFFEAMVELEWSPRISFEELAQRMVLNDIKLLDEKII